MTPVDCLLLVSNNVFFFFFPILGAQIGTVPTQDFFLFLFFIPRRMNVGHPTMKQCPMKTLPRACIVHLPPAAASGAADPGAGPAGNQETQAPARGDAGTAGFQSQVVVGRAGRGVVGALALPVAGAAARGLSLSLLLSEEGTEELGSLPLFVAAAAAAAVGDFVGEHYPAVLADVDALPCHVG